MQMEERRKAKLVDMDKYQKLNKEIRKMCKKAKTEWLEEQCDEVKVLQRRNPLTCLLILITFVLL